MRTALASSGPAVAGSAVTVILALLTLLFASLGGNRSIGWTSAVGVVVVLVCALVVLPAALVLCGRRLFWPFIPRAGDADLSHRGPWARIARAVVVRPAAVAAGAAAVLVVLALGISGARLGLSDTEQFRVRSESASGLETLSQHFPGGASSPAEILTSRELGTGRRHRRHEGAGRGVGAGERPGRRRGPGRRGAEGPPRHRGELRHHPRGARRPWTTSRGRTPSSAARSPPHWTPATRRSATSG